MNKKIFFSILFFIILYDSFGQKINYSDLTGTTWQIIDTSTNTFKKYTFIDASTIWTHFRNGDLVARNSEEYYLDTSYASTLIYFTSRATDDVFKDIHNYGFIEMDGDKLKLALLKTEEKPKKNNGDYVVKDVWILKKIKLEDGKF